MYHLWPRRLTTGWCWHWDILIIMSEWWLPRAELKGRVRLGGKQMFVSPNHAWGKTLNTECWLVCMVASLLISDWIGQQPSQGLWYWLSGQWLINSCKITLSLNQTVERHKIHCWPISQFNSPAAFIVACMYTPLIVCVYGSGLWVTYTTMNAFVCIDSCMKMKIM